MNANATPDYINPSTNHQEHPCFWVQYYADHANIYRVYGGLYARVRGSGREELLSKVKGALGHNYQPIATKATPH